MGLLTTSTPMPSMLPVTAMTPFVFVSTAANATSAHSGSGPIIQPRCRIGVTWSAGRSSMDTVTSVPSGVQTRHSFDPLSFSMAATARSVEAMMSSTVRSQSPMPPSTEAILTLLAHDSLTAETCANRFAHSRLVMMMISSAASIASCRFLGGAIGNSVSARPRATCVSLFMITGHAPRSAATSATTLARWACSSSRDDRDHVALLDREAGVDDELRVLADLRVGRHPATSPCRLPLDSRLAERRQHVAREPLHLPELVERAEAADEVVDARRGERPEPLDDLLRRVRPGPSSSARVALRQLRVVLADVVPERGLRAAASESPMLSVTW